MGNERIGNEMNVLEVNRRGKRFGKDTNGELIYQQKKRLINCRRLYCWQ
jgi:hypothetical protein